MTLSELSIDISTFTRNEVLVADLANALSTPGLILALQVIKNVAGTKLPNDPSQALGMLSAVALLQNLANLVKPQKEFDPKTHFMMPGVGPIALELLPEELRTEPEPPQ